MQLRLSTVMFFGSLLPAGAWGQTVEEYQVKAAFLYNFAKFVEWPQQAFRAPTDPIRICVLGPNPFGGALEEAIHGKLVEGRGFAVREVADAAEGCNCQMVFVGTADRKRFRSILEKLRASGILTIGEAPGFAADGGVINFRLENGKVRFEINVDAAAEQRIRVSSKLLTLALIVKNGANR